MFRNNSIPLMSALFDFLLLKERLIESREIVDSFYVVRIGAIFDLVFPDVETSDCIAVGEIN